MASRRRPLAVRTSAITRPVEARSMPSMLVTLRQLEYVVAIADHGSFRKAAAAAGVTQPGLSAQIAALEQALAVQLFERDRRTVLVTTIGAAVISRARETIAAANRVVDTARGAAEPLTGRLRLGIIPTIAPFLLPTVLPTLRRRYPRLQLILREERTATLLSQLDAGVLDAAVVALPVAGDLAVAALYREEFWLAVPRGHRLARRATVREPELGGHEVLLLEDGHCLREQALAVCSSAGARESSELRATSLTTLWQMVAGGLGVTLIPARAGAAMAGRNSGVECVRFAGTAPGRDVGLVWRMSSARGRELSLLTAVLTPATQPT
jgi:LysR family transcriptional regulator, hydrogen peroxide-inducible genes activator